MESREESQGFYEMLWDCPHCETKGLLGKSQRHCAECGAPQDASKRYFPTPEQQKLVVGHVYEGADRNCASCSSPQAARAKNCTQCGAPLPVVAPIEGAPPSSPAGDGLSAADAALIDAAVDETRAAMMSTLARPPEPEPIWKSRPLIPADKPPAPRKPRPWLVPVILGGVVVIAVAIWFLFLRTRHAEVIVTAHRWERTIAIEQYGDQQHTGWRDEVPAGASGKTCIRKQRSSHQVPDGESCHTEKRDRKDGTFEQVNVCTPKTRSEGVDDDYCTYTTPGWGKVSDARNGGAGLTPEPSWPSADVSSSPSEVYGARRAGAHKETLTLDFGASDSCDVSDTVWHKYTDGQKIQVDVRARSGAVVCSSL